MEKAITQSVGNITQKELGGKEKLELFLPKKEKKL